MYATVSYEDEIMVVHFEGISLWCQILKPDLRSQIEESFLGCQWFEQIFSISVGLEAMDAIVVLD